MQDKKQQVNYLLPSNFPSIESILEPLKPWFEFEGFFGTTYKVKPSFDAIYQRELKKTKAQDTEAFRSWLIVKVSEMKDYEQSLPAKDRERSLDVQNLADEFIKWIQTKQAQTQKAFNSGSFTFKNNFDHIDPKDVYDHFKTLVSRKYLTEKELQTFLKNAFELPDLPEKRLSFSGVASKSNIYKIFHSYYKNKASHPFKKQLEYVRLLSNYFEGYKENTVKTNWTKY